MEAGDELCCRFNQGHCNLTFAIFRDIFCSCCATWPATNNNHIRFGTTNDSGGAQHHAGAES